jgi:hypothetical protein
MSCDPRFFASFSVSAYDPEGIRSLAVVLYTAENTVIAELELGLSEGIYSGETYLTEPYTVYDIHHYVFQARDGLRNIEMSKGYGERSSSCLTQQVGFHDQASR